MRGVQRIDDTHRVRRAVEEIRIAEADVRRALRHLRADVGEHDLDGDDAELAEIDSRPVERFKPPRSPTAIPVALDSCRPAETGAIASRSRTAHLR